MTVVFNGKVIKFSNIEIRSCCKKNCTGLMESNVLNCKRLTNKNEDRQQNQP